MKTQVGKIGILAVVMFSLFGCGSGQSSATKGSTGSSTPNDPAKVVTEENVAAIPSAVPTVPTGITENTSSQAETVTPDLK